MSATLDEHTERAALTDEEIQRCLRAGVIQSLFADHPIAIVPRFCIRTDTQLPKVVGETVNDGDLLSATGLFEETDRRVNDAVA